MDSVILVTVKSRFAGRKFFTPLMRFSKLAPKLVVKFEAIPEAPRRSVRRPPMDVKLLKRFEDEDGGWKEAWEGWRVVVIIVMRVVARTL